MTSSSPESSTPLVDSQWIRAVVQEFESQLIRHAARLLRGDVHRARDVVQDTFLKLWQADRRSVEPYLAQWLFTVSRNRALDVIRKESRMTSLNGQTSEGASASSGKSATATIEQKPDRMLSDSEDKSRAVGLLDVLPDKQQEAIRLKLQAQLSYKEIAKVMETSVSNVGVLIHTGLKAIRLQLDPAAASPTTTPTNLPGMTGGR